MERTSMERRADGLAGVEFLMPDREQGIARSRGRDFVEDANFEVVGGDRSPWTGSVPPLMPEAPDSGRHRHKRAIAPASGRLDLFGKAAVNPGRFASGPALPAFAVLLCLAAGAVFWMSGGHALFVQAPMLADSVEAAMTTHERSKVPAVLAPPLSPVAGSATNIPSATMSTPPRQQAKPVRRPPRIERAGSILMIRSGG